MRTALILSVLSQFVSFSLPAEQKFQLTANNSILTTNEINYLGGLKTLTVCSVAQAVGSNASIDIVKLISAKTGLKVIASGPMAWEEGVKGLASGVCDILPWATDTAARRQTMNFTRPYARIVRVLVTRKEQPYIGSISNFLDKTYVTEKNNHVVNQLRRKYPNLLTMRVEHTMESLEMVAQKKAFASIASLYSVGNLFDRSEARDLKIAGQLPPQFDDVVSLATRKNDQLLNQILDKAVLTTNQRDIANFMNRSAVFVYSTKMDYSKYWLFGFTALFVISGLLWWIRYLRALNSRLAMTQIELEKKSTELEMLSTTDSLTKTFNRHKLDEVLVGEITRSNRYSNDLSIIMLDIDFFKDVNDKFGHMVGDEILTKFAELLRDNIRNNDMLGRWGGEEFLIICSGIGATSARAAANKLRIIIEQADFAPAHGLTASFGVAERISDDSKETLVLRADKALYTSKHRGRNQVTIG